MNIFKTIKERINNNLTAENKENGFSVIEGIAGVAVMSTVAVVGVSNLNSDSVMGLFNQAKQAQTASLLQDTMTNIVFYDIDGDPETDTKYAIDRFNQANSEKGFTADYRQNGECLAVQVMADNGINSIQTDGNNCGSFVEELNRQADEIKRSGSDTEINVVSVNHTKQVKTASLLQDTMTNVAFYNIDNDPETDTKYAIEEFNKANSEKGFTADYRQNGECLAVQVMADNGINSIQSEGKDCDGFVNELNRKADEIKKANGGENNDGVLDDNVIFAFFE